MTLFGLKVQRPQFHNLQQLLPQPRVVHRPRGVRRRDERDDRGGLALGEEDRDARPHRGELAAAIDLDGLLDAPIFRREIESSDAGAYDLLIEVVCEDNDALLTFLTDRLRSIAGVLETETFVYLRILKQNYEWGTTPT